MNTLKIPLQRVWLCYLCQQSAFYPEYFYIHFVAYINLQLMLYPVYTISSIFILLPGD